jgi:psiF repeat
LFDIEHVAILGGRPTDPQFRYKRNNNTAKAAKNHLHRHQTGLRVRCVRECPTDVLYPVSTHFNVWRNNMKQLVSLVILGFALAAGAAHAADDGKTKQQNKMATCNKEASDKKGDERKAFMKSCLSNKPAQAAAPAAPAATQQGKMKTCNADAKTKALKGDERKKFMSECLSAK